jgi:hypothetical protein
MSAVRVLIGQQRQKVAFERLFRSRWRGPRVISLEVYRVYAVTPDCNQAAPN